MNTKIKAAIAGLALISFASASAQHTYSGYFLDNYTYRYQMNPAFGNKDGFVSFPVLGNVNIAMRGNLHLTDVLYNVGGKTVLFTNPEVYPNNPSAAVNKFKNVNRLETNEKFDILNIGFKAFGGYNTVSIGARVNAGVHAPKSFFRLAKEGVRNDKYSIKDLRAYGNAFAQIALNHSREIYAVEGLRVGAALKFYIGAGNLDARFKDAYLDLGTDSWNATTNADIYASINDFKFKTKYNEQREQDYVSGADISYKGLNGFGIGFDLGAEYKWRDFSFSLALLDLGFISWGKTQVASTDGYQTFESDAFTFDASDLGDGWDRMKDDFEKLYQLKDMGEKSSRTTGIGATLNIGVEYELPYYRPLHFGFLSSTVINGPYTWSQARFSANVAPVNWFSATANLEASTFGCGFGWMINFWTKGINFFVGMDHTMGKLAKQGVPLNSNAAVNLGINFPF